jgi:hypothetical protein
MPQLNHTLFNKALTAIAAPVECKSSQAIVYRVGEEIVAVQIAGERFRWVSEHWRNLGRKAG